MHRIFIGGEGRKYVIADSALKHIQVHAGAFWLDAEEHHPSFALWTGVALKGNRWNGGRLALRLGQDAFPQIGGSTTLSVTGIAKDTETVMVQVCTAGIPNTSYFACPGANCTADEIRLRV
jgi:hypothetical protein